MISGKYVISSNGKVLAESPNIITSSGLYSINRFLVGTSNTKTWAGTMKVGASYTATSTSDTLLAYETRWSPTSGLKYNSGSITLSAQFNNFVGEIYEIGIVPQTNFSQGIPVTDFSEQYTTASSYWFTPLSGNMNVRQYALTDYTIGNSRYGSTSVWAKTGSAYYLDTTGGFDTSNWSTSASVYLDLLYFVPKDSIGGTTPSLTFILTDVLGAKWTTSTSALNVSSSGYKKIAIQLGANKDATYLNSFKTITASFFGGTGSISLDALYYRANQINDSDQALLSRTSASAPILQIVKQPQTIQIDYYLQVT